MPRSIVACALGAALTALPLTAAAQDLTADTVIARVGGTEITMGHVVLMRQQLPQQYAQLPDNVLFEGIVEQLIDQQLLGSELDGELPRNARLQLENESRAVRAGVSIQAVMDPPVDEADIEAAYDDAFANLPPEQEFNASHILVETEEEALALIDALNGGADFAELAKEKSTGPSGPSGGELGWFGKGRMVPEFETAVLEMEPEGISAPVQTQFGWHVIRLNDQRDIPPPTLEEARGQLEQELRSKRLSDHLAGLRDAVQVEMLIEGIDPASIRDDEILSGDE